MNIPSFREINQVTDSRYSLIMLVSKRARALVDGAEPLIETKLTKPVSIAIEEIMQGSVTFGTQEEEEAQEIQREAKRRLEEIIAQEEEE